MTQNNNTYRPYKSNIYFSVFATLVSVISFILFGLLLNNFEPMSITLLVEAVISLLFAKGLYDSSYLTVSICESGLLITEKRKTVFTAWSDLNYAYRLLNAKGHVFWALSSKPVDEKKAKKTLNLMPISKIIKNELIIFPEDDFGTKNSTLIKCIKEHLPNIIDTTNHAVD